MLDREPFLKAIFAVPDDDLPRLVYADFLEEQGETDRAELIRVQCELARFRKDPTPGQDIWPLYGRNRELVRSLYGYDPEIGFGPVRGFLPPDIIEVTAEQLADPDGFRRTAIADHPEWYGATRLKVTDGRILSPAPLATIFTSPVTEHVTELDLSGREIDLGVHLATGDDPALPLFDIEVRPVIGVAMVEELARTREARRLIELDLTNNNLDSSAAMALARSPHLFRLERLYFSMGNHLKAPTWQRLFESFGDKVQ